MADLIVSGSFYTSNDPVDPQGWTLRVVDEVSHTLLADVAIKPEDFLSIMRGGQIHVKGLVSPNLDRVGKKMRVWTQMVPTDVSGWTSESAVLARSGEWAEANAGEPYDDLEIRRQNSGVTAIYRIWEEVEQNG